MTEAMLSYAWKFRCFKAVELKTTSGIPLVVLKTGKENRDSGPDFFLAEIRVDDTHWVGNVEIHQRSSDWNLHDHQNDKAYNNVILHVVYEHDREIFIGDRVLPTLELKAFMEPNFLGNFGKLQDPRSNIPCESQLDTVDDFHVQSFLQTLVIERYQQKAEQINFLYDKNKQDLRETFYQWLFIGFGRKVNKDPFQYLSEIIPFKLIKAYRNSPDQIAALLFGTSGLLPSESIDPYVTELISRFRFLKVKHQLDIMDSSNWKFLRMRPSNFPTLRIAQLSSLLCHHNLMELMRDGHNDEVIGRVLHSLRLPDFWEQHFSFNGSTLVREKSLGKDFIRHLLLNVIIPFRLFRSRVLGKEIDHDAFEILNQLEPENNVITRRMVTAGFKNVNSGQSQGLVQLHNLYCEHKKCLLCKIGYQILRT